MSELIVRRLMIDLEHGFARRWHGGDAFRSALFNALSMSFPVGEQFFIDSVRAGVAQLAPEARAKFADELAGFVGQEATHRRIHGLFNAQLAKQGYTNTWQERAQRRVAAISHLAPRHRVAITAGYEHYTAILADWMLTHEEHMDGVDVRLKTLWLWHSVEESEHKSTAFDVYLALGGTAPMRKRWFFRLSFFFITDLVRQTVRNLAHDQALWRCSTWRSAGHFLFGRRGLLRAMARPWRAYLAADFHPSQLDNSALTARWLAQNSARFRVVGDQALA